MLSNLSMLKCKVNGNDYQFLCDCNSPTGEIKEALFQFVKFVGKVEDAANSQQVEEKLTEKEPNYCCSPEIKEE
jgi:hypothetical protein